ncbi:MAG: cyclase family protein [Cyanobacteria bacterium REEB67]|nr:cyclase family protein [Cyanobacteria bacterium REEB67]
MDNSQNLLPSLIFSRIIDISQPVSTMTACFPGDVPFSKKITLSYESSQIINLTAFTMSPHVGTHADAPVHIKGKLSEEANQTASENGTENGVEKNTKKNAEKTAEKGADTDTTAGALALHPFLGRVYVMDLAPHTGAIGGSAILDQLTELATVDEITRVIFKTRSESKPHLFEDDYSYIGEDTAEKLGELGFVLTGLDTPSVDHTESKDLATHNVLDRFNLCWLENLDLSAVEEGEYQLIALPLKFIELEASPVRAILLA